MALETPENNRDKHVATHTNDKEEAKQADKPAAKARGGRLDDWVINMVV